MMATKFFSFLFISCLFNLSWGQVPPLEDQHFFSPGMFNVDTNDGIPFADDLFKISRPEPCLPGDKVELKCQLAAGQRLKEGRCVFETPTGMTLISNPKVNNSVFNEEHPGTPIKGLTALSSGQDENICGLAIDSMGEEYFGRWNCVFNRGQDDIPEHRGHFTILNKEDGLFVRDVRLPRHVVPEHYKVELFPHIEEKNFTISGSIKMTFKVTEDVEWGGFELYTKIYMHAKDIAIDESSVKVHDGIKEIQIKGHEYGYERDFYIIHLKQPMPIQTPLFVEIKFTSYLNDNLVGFYRSSYFDQAAGKTKYLAVTQFESHYARQAFPCLDEPDQKATFDVTLTHHKDMTALSNMNMISQEAVPNYPDFNKTNFATSVKMSTYLVAFIVSEFGSTASPNDPAYKIWHQKSKSGQAELAAQYGSQILKYFETFFNVSYPLPKMDMAAIPDFSAGAMENWGLITYRETLLLYVDGISDLSNKEEIIKVMAHELAHQWFGNLVTMKWWTDLWLNEGFATYTMYHGMGNVLTESRARDRIVIYDVQKVLEVDSLDNTAPLSSEVTNPKYDADFGAIAYSKGCSILRMIENFLTLDTFKKGVSNYLKSRAYSNAERDDLWQALTDAAREDGRLPSYLSVKDIMDGWTLQAGYPVLSVELFHNNYIWIAQKRFYLDPNVTEIANTTWIVPITLAYPKSGSGMEKTTPDFWLLDTQQRTNMELTERPYIINVDQTGYYRVNYDTANWNALAEQLKENHTKVKDLNRAQLLDDSMSLARAGQLSYPTALAITEYLDKETEFIPWQSALKSFSFLELMLNDNSTLTEFSYLQKYLIKQLTPLYNSLGFDASADDKHLDVLKRKSSLFVLCRFNHEECVNKSTELFNEWMKTPTDNKIEANLRETVYHTAIRAGGQPEWDFLWDRFVEATVDSERLKLIYALGASGDQECINRYLNETLNGDPIRLQDVVYVYRAIGARAPGRRFQFEWLNNNWDKIREHFGGRFDDYMINLVSGYAAAANTQPEIEKLETFLEERTPELGTAIAELKRLIETAKANSGWMEKNSKVVADWLKERVEDGSTNSANGIASMGALIVSLVLATIATFVL